MRKDYAQIRKNLRDYFDPMKKQHLNVVVLNTGNTLEHEIKKAEICFKLQQHGHEFICEGILRNGKRPDITVLDVEPPIAYEITHSEKEASILQKSQAYGNIRIIPIPTEKNNG